MASRKKWFIIVLILLLALLMGGLIYLLWGGYLNGVSKEPTGTWSVEESFPGSPVSDFTVTVRNLKDATHFELHIEDVQIGDRVPLDGSIRSVALIFSKPEMMEVWFFDSADATEPFIRAECHQSGTLIFPGSEGAFGNDSNNADGGNDDSTGSAQPSQKGDGVNPAPQPERKKSGDGLLDEIKRWFNRAKARILQQPLQEELGREMSEKDEGGTAPSVDGSSTGNNQKGGSSEKDPAAAKPAGSWFVEPDTLPTALFKVSVVNIDSKAFYELQASDMAVGKRVRLDEGICSISLMFSEPSELRVKFFADRDTATVLAEAKCTEEGALKFIE